VQIHITGFGGDPANVTALGQSAGGESVSVLSMSEEVRGKGLFERGVAMSGTLVTMPTLTREEYMTNLLPQAGKRGFRRAWRGA
jgi:carboxylesterase type B